MHWQLYQFVFFQTNFHQILLSVQIAACLEKILLKARNFLTITAFYSMKSMQVSAVNLIPSVFGISHKFLLIIIPTYNTMTPSPIYWRRKLWGRGLSIVTRSLLHRACSSGLKSRQCTFNICCSYCAWTRCLILSLYFDFEFYIK